MHSHIFCFVSQMYADFSKHEKTPKKTKEGPLNIMEKKEKKFKLPNIYLNNCKIIF